MVAMRGEAGPREARARVRFHDEARLSRSPRTPTIAMTTPRAPPRSRLLLGRRFPSQLAPCFAPSPAGEPSAFFLLLSTSFTSLSPSHTRPHRHPWPPTAFPTQPHPLRALPTMSMTSSPSGSALPPSHSLLPSSNTTRTPLARDRPPTRPSAGSRMRSGSASTRRCAHARMASRRRGDHCVAPLSSASLTSSGTLA